MILNGKLVNPEVRIETTNKCNYHCVFCPREKLTRKPRTMDNDIFYNLVDQSYDLGAKMISPFGYGEPLLDNDIAKKVSYCTKSGLKTFLTTNASLLDTDAAFKLLDAGLSNIRFSFHGVYPGEYKAVHRVPYHEPLRNINNFISINKIRYESRCKIDIITICDDIEKAKDMWSVVDLLEVWKPHNWAGGRSYRKVERKKITCGRPFNGPIQILVDGKMVVCCFDFNGKMVIGDTKKKSIKDILEGVKFKKIQQSHKDGDIENLICKGCDQLNIEDQSPLLYSSVGDLEINKTAGAKFKLES